MTTVMGIYLSPADPSLLGSEAHFWLGYYRNLYQAGTVFTKLNEGSISTLLARDRAWRIVRVSGIASLAGQVAVVDFKRLDPVGDDPTAAIRKPDDATLPAEVVGIGIEPAGSIPEAEPGPLLVKQVFPGLIACQAHHLLPDGVEPIILALGETLTALIKVGVRQRRIHADIKHGVCNRRQVRNKPSKENRY